MSETIKLGENSKIEGEKVELGKSIKIGDNVIIKGKEICMRDNVIIGNNTVIFGKSIHIGFGSEIEENCKIVLPEHGEFSIQDNCFIGHNSKILVPLFKTGDYVELHNHLFVNGISPCTIGHNVWVGQNCILNALDRLTIGNGVGIGTYSCIWTHGGHGELLEGCNIFKVAPVVIEDDAWLVGSYNVVSPGVRIGEKSVILTGSIVTKDVAPYSCVAGNPAREITDKIHPYREITIEEKYEMMKKFMKEFVNTFYKENALELRNGWRVKDDKQTYEIIFLPKADDKSIKNDLTKVIFTKEDTTTKNYKKVTIFDLSTKKYTKRRTKIEVDVIKFLLYNKARFLPS